MVQLKHDSKPIIIEWKSGSLLVWYSNIIRVCVAQDSIYLKSHFNWQMDNSHKRKSNGNTDEKKSTKSHFPPKDLFNAMPQNGSLI